MGCKRIVIDTDPGVDDAHAILILLDADKLNLVKIEAIIVTKGNTTVENGSKNVVRLLQMKNRTDIPVYRGVQYALLSNEEGASTYFGNDGMADLDYDEEPDLTFLSVKPAPLALLELVEQNPNEISLVCLAPLTNVALAAGLNGKFFEKVKEVFIMGGNWRGNETECAEFNFHYDPEAAYMVLQKLKCPTTVLANETCLDAAIDVNWRLDTLVNDSIDLTFMAMVERKFLSITRGDKETWVPFDVFMALLILYPDVVVRAVEYHVTVELHGYFTRGQMVLDHLRNRKPNVTLVQEIDRDYIMQILLNWYQIDK